jgi:hypothetical protein
MLTRKEKGIFAILVVVPLVFGFIIGVTVGGAMAERPYTTERTMVWRHIKESKSHETKPLECSIVAWSHSEPVDEKWWSRCMNDFNDET